MSYFFHSSNCIANSHEAQQVMAEELLISREISIDFVPFTLALPSPLVPWHCAHVSAIRSAKCFTHLRHYQEQPTERHCQVKVTKKTFLHVLHCVCKFFINILNSFVSGSLFHTYGLDWLCKTHSSRNLNLSCRNLAAFQRESHLFILIIKTAECFLNAHDF